MYAQSIMLGDDELSINNFDEIMDWIIILFLYELCRIIKYRNIENKKKFLKYTYCAYILFQTYNNNHSLEKYNYIIIFLEGVFCYLFL